MVGFVENTDALAGDLPDALAESIELVLERASEVEAAVNEHLQDPQAHDLEELTRQIEEVVTIGIVVLERLSGRSSHPFDSNREFGDARYAIEMADHELRGQARKLADIEVDQDQRQRVLVTIAQTKGVVTKAFVNIEQSLCLAIDREPEFARYLALEDSLETRRAYGKMRRALLKFDRLDETPAHDEVVARLRRAGTSFVHLRGHDCYPTLRVEDRFQFEKLWDRVYGWLQSEEQDEQTYAGWLIWQDVINFVELLGSINFRQELREHDLALAARSLDRLVNRGDQEPVGAQAAEDLRWLTGYSAAIDELIERGANAPTGPWRKQLRRIQHGI